MKIIGNEGGNFGDDLIQMFEPITQFGRINPEKLGKHGWQETNTDVMKRVVQWELRKLFTKSHHKIVFGMVEFKKDVNTTVSHHPVHKWFREWGGGFELPITKNELL